MNTNTKRTGVSIGRLHITWWDLWAKRRCFEVKWEKP